MVLTPPVQMCLLEMEIHETRERHMVRLHGRAIDPTPITGDNDYAYVTPNTALGAETSVAETFANVATALLDPYYNEGWELVFRTLYTVIGRDAVPVDPQPLFLSIAASLAPPHVGGDQTTARIFRMTSTLGGRRRLWLRQITHGSVAPRISVTPTGGGLDRRDRGVMAYLSGNATALVAPDGAPFNDVGVVWSWYDRPIADVPVLP